MGRIFSSSCFPCGDKKLTILCTVSLNPNAGTSAFGITRYTTLRICRRHTTTLRSTVGCATSGKLTPSYTWASTEHWNGEYIIILCSKVPSTSLISLVTPIISVNSRVRLPGKGVGLSNECYPDTFLDDMPLVYPFIINDPGEGMQSKRRAHSVIIDHLTPPMTTADG